jgi:hypothetical protein
MTTSTIVWGSVIVVVALALLATMPDPPSLGAILPSVPNGLDALAHAIAFAEGYGADANNVPTRANNPGDLKLSGTPVTGDEGISVFDSIDAGWVALNHQLSLIASGASHVYDGTMTIAEVGMKWTDTQADDWTANVVSYLNTHGYPSVTADTPVNQVLA